MKLMIASDIHGSAFWCEKMLARFEAEKADTLLLLGDLLYHGPRNDLPDGYAPKKVIEMLNQRRDSILSVRGNCEAEVDQMVLSFPVLADYIYLYLEERVMFATHGHVYNRDHMPPMRKGDILLHGHTHVPCWEKVGEQMILNPGSVSIPKENSPHSYMTLEGGVFLWKDMDGEVYHEIGRDETNARLGI
ncbi:MAG: phosphodiesterase [Clostridia bacterium]|nr:phosphodiesterase [Clostridia bacterium]